MPELPVGVPYDGTVAVRPVEAARRLGVSRTIVFELLASGRLRSIKAGRSRLIPVSELYRFVNVDPTPPAA